MVRLGQSLLVLALACLIAGLFGALHDQVSFTIGPSYFFDLKFDQFRIPDQFHNRVGAAIVGWQASWWMGLMLGIPTVLLALIVLPKPLFPGLRAIWRATLCAALGAGIGLGIAYLSPEIPNGFPDDIGFFRAAVMHEGAYLGGAVGLIAALWTIWRANRHLKRKEHHAT